MLPPEFSVTVARHGETVTVGPAGELDLATAPVLADHLDVAAAASCDRVVLDLSRLTFIDSSGVALLIGIARRAGREGWALAISGTPPHALRVLGLCGLLDALPLERS